MGCAIPSEHNRLLTSCCHKPPVPQLELPATHTTTPTSPCCANLGKPVNTLCPLPAPAASGPPGLLQPPVTSSVPRQLFTTMTLFASLDNPGDRKIMPVLPTRRLRPEKVTQTVRSRAQPRPKSASSEFNYLLPEQLLRRGCWSVVVTAPGL